METQKSERLISVGKLYALGVFLEQETDSNLRQISSMLSVTLKPL